jgi:adenine specific DNA methylase Mod
MQALLTKGYEGKFDLIYIDPPFNTGEDFNFPTNITVEQTSYKKELSMVERLAYTDTWERGVDSFLDMFYPRLKLLRRLLDDTGALFVHCDYHIEHAIKLLMDEIFGPNNFRNQIFVPRIRKNVQEREMSKKLNVGLDTILFYVKSDQTRIRIPKKPEIKPERWHNFEASGIRRGMDYELFGRKPNPGNHWRWTQETCVFCH